MVVMLFVFFLSKVVGRRLVFFFFKLLNSSICIIMRTRYTILYRVNSVWFECNIMSVYVNRFDAHNNAMMIVYHVFWLKIHVFRAKNTEIIQFLDGVKTIFLKCYFNVTRLCNAFLTAAIHYKYTRIYI